jgi:hypothetical protein
MGSKLVVGDGENPSIKSKGVFEIVFLFSNKTSLFDVFVGVTIDIAALADSFPDGIDEVLKEAIGVLFCVDVF